MIMIHTVDEPPAADDRAALLECALSAKLVNKIAQMIAAQRTVSDLVRTAIEQTRILCEADGASLLLIDPATFELVFERVEGSGAGRLEQVRIARGRGVAGWVARERAPIRVADVRHCPEFDSSVDQQSGFITGSIVAVPLILRGELLGVLEAVRSNAEEPFEDRFLKRLIDLSPHVAIAVRQAQMDDKLRTMNDDLLAANARLEEKVDHRTQMLARAKREWERTFDAINDPIALQDGFVVRRANLAWARAVGVPITAVPGRKCHELLAGQPTPCVNCPILKGRDTKDMTGELEARGSTFRFSGFWVSEDLADSSVVMQYRDVTVLKQLEAKAREGERLVAVGQLADGAAHEINNPIAYVSANLQSLRGLLAEITAGRADPQELADCGEMIAESMDGVRRVKEIVAGLREFARLEVTSSEPTNVNVSVGRLVARLPDGFRPELSLEAVALAQIAPLQLDQALWHILRNAQQAVTAGQQVRVRTRAEGAEVWIEVKDEGAGIQAQHLGRIFEPFFTTRGIGKGIGLGLTAAHGIVRRAGGEIAVVSAPGRGSTFTIKLPIAA